MGTIKLVVIGLIILGVFLYIKQPDMYSKTYGFAWDKGKELYNGYIGKDIEENPEPLNQDEIQGNTIVPPECGKILGRPYDLYIENNKEVRYYFLCTENAHCYRFSSYARCLNESGECMISC